MDDLERSEQSKLHSSGERNDIDVARTLRGSATLPQRRCEIVVVVEADIWMLADEIDVDPGEVLVQNGAPAGHAFVIRSGSAEAVKGLDRRLLGPGSAFDATDAHLVVTARSAMELLVVDVRRATAVLAAREER